ncbi:apolipoprotein N-acyltransferase [Virgisporangium aliadipatigenens]|uniref:Apolipoprotein N-acyltransferase n=1 Tax=Virgisporangium aliadipatigenens TaxID=741659 RepID=A0A8J3YS54_9ACTN|nr:nitrilase-related carbon-nitrogen hydrolase [Virgisporangium aliadipatigenens]GIJ48743.1 apolipoprotein N-acyltransferase [Virgisporangium aliadipatigenens]
MIRGTGPRAVVAAAASAILFRYGTGLAPLWWCAWLAPLPVLLLASRTRARVAVAAAFVAWLVGESGLWSYYTGSDGLAQPIPLVAGVFVALAALFAGVVAGFGYLVPRNAAAAALFPPAAWVLVEYALSVATPNGLFWSLAYTQVDALPVVQLAAITGPWGLTFAVLGLPSAVAAASAAPRPSRIRLAAAALCCLAFIWGNGLTRLAAAAEPASGHTVGVVALAQPADPVALSTEEGRRLLDGYVARVRAVGARTVVLPEKVFAADESTLPLLDEAFRTVARESTVDIVVGLTLTRAGTTHNVALVYPRGGAAASEYRKAHLVPTLEDAMTAGRDRTLVAGDDGRRGIAVCKDLDYPELVRAYRADGARLMLVPAWDFDRDAWLHSRMAILRGVENGLPIARAARSGTLTVTDAYGRVLAEDRASAVAPVPPAAGRTVYSVLGEWFVWLCLPLLALGWLRRPGRP